MIVGKYLKSILSFHMYTHICVYIHQNMYIYTYKYDNRDERAFE